MPNIFAALTGIADRPPPRASDAEPRREPPADDSGFDDAYAARAPSREKPGAKADRSYADNNEPRPADVVADKPGARPDTLRRPLTHGVPTPARTKTAEILGAALAEVGADDAPVLFRPEVSDQPIAAAAPAALDDAAVLTDAATTDLTLVPLADAAPAAAALTLDIVFATQAAAIPIDAAVDTEASPVEGLARAAAPTGVATGQAAPVAGQAGAPAATPGKIAKSEIAGSEEAKGKDAKGDKDPAAPTFADVGGQTAADIDPARTDVPAPPTFKLKEKTARPHTGAEGALEIGAPTDRITHSAPAHSAAEARLAPAHVAASADAAAQVIAAIRTGKDSNEIDVRLDPPELGRVKISLAFERSDIVTATVSAERSDTLDLLRRHQEDLSRELERAGFSKVRLDFSTNDSGRAFSDQPRAQQSWRQAAFGEEAIDDVRVNYLTLRADNRLDRLV